MARNEHEFQFEAYVIANAAEKEAAYHRGRLEWWQTEYKNAIARVKETASVEVTEYPVTGGMRADVTVNHGDPAAYKRMQEAMEKIQSHREAAERYETDATV